MKSLSLWNNKKFEVQIYYSGFCCYNVEAKNEMDAVGIAKSLPLKKNEILSNLEIWDEANTAEELDR